MILTLGFIIVGVVLAVLGIFLTYGGMPDGYDKKAHGGLIGGGVLIAFLGLILGLGGLGFTQIDPGEVGVVVTNGVVDEKPLGPGIHWRLPLVAHVAVLDEKVQVYDIPTDNNEIFTKDKYASHIRGSINWRILPDQAYRVLNEVGGLDEVKRQVDKAATEALKQQSRPYTIDEITAKRDEYGARARTQMNTKLLAYGAEVVSVFVTNVEAPQAYLDAVNKINEAELNKQKAQAEADQANITAIGRKQVAITQAEGEKQATITRAEGEAQANDLIQKSLTPGLLQWRSIEKLNPQVQVMYLPSGSGFLFQAPQPVASAAP